jgi:serine/threonine protein phosphatase PrpC
MNPYFYLKTPNKHH